MRILLLSMVLLAACAGSAFADDDQDRAYRALRRGEIVLFEQVLAAIRPSHAGTILEIELERRHGHWVYELETLREDGVIELDTRSTRVTRDGMPVVLTPFEYRVLAYLMHEPDRIVSQAELTEHVYAQDFDRDSNTIEVIIGRLCKKLGRDAIVTARGLGYRLGPSA